MNGDDVKIVLVYFLFLFFIFRFFDHFRFAEPEPYKGLVNGDF